MYSSNVYFCFCRLKMEKRNGWHWKIENVCYQSKVQLKSKQHWSIRIWKLFWEHSIQDKQLIINLMKSSVLEYEKKAKSDFIELKTSLFRYFKAIKQHVSRSQNMLKGIMNFGKFINYCFQWENPVISFFAFMVRSRFTC